MNLRANPNNFIAIAIAVILFAIGFALNVMHMQSINDVSTAYDKNINTLPATTDSHSLNGAPVPGKSGTQLKQNISANKAPGISDTKSAE
jgi:hypothetical protein